MISFLSRLGLILPPPIQGDLVALQPFQRRHLRLIREWFKDEDLLRLAFGVSASSDILLKLGRDFLSDLFFSSKELLMVTLPDHGAIGLVSFAIREEEGKIARVGILIGEMRRRGRGYGTDALKALIAHLFEKRKVRRVELDTALFNEQAQRCFLRCGFRKTGELSEIDFRNGQAVNKVMMGITREEYFAHG